MQKEPSPVLNVYIGISSRLTDRQCDAGRNALRDIEKSIYMQKKGMFVVFEPTCNLIIIPNKNINIYRSA